MKAWNAMMYCMECFIINIPIGRVFYLIDKLLSTLLEFGLTNPLVSLINNFCLKITNFNKKLQIQKLLLDVISVILLRKNFIPFGAPEHLKMFNSININVNEGNNQIISQCDIKNVKIDIKIPMQLGRKKHFYLMHFFFKIKNIMKKIIKIGS